MFDPTFVRLIFNSTTSTGPFFYVLVSPIVVPALVDVDIISSMYYYHSIVEINTLKKMQITRQNNTLS